MALLKPFGVTEDTSRKRRGAVKALIGVVEGRKQGFTLHVHSEHQEISKHYIRAIRDRFKIPSDRFYAD